MQNETSPLTYGTAILSGFEFLLEHYPEVFVIGQGLWSPWYVGSSMTDLDKKFGIERVIDTPVSESACTGAAVGAAIAGMKPIVVHPRMDFMLYAMDAIVNEAAKWHHMTGGQSSVPVTIRAIINRGGEQGAQHSQALHAWFAHIPGLRVVMPATVADARDLLIASVLSEDPVMFIDDRWLYEQEAVLPKIELEPLSQVKPKLLAEGQDVTLVGMGYGTKCAMEAHEHLLDLGVSAEVIDLRVLNPLDLNLVVRSVQKTGRLITIDPGWGACSVGSEVIAVVTEELHEARALRAPPKRINLPAAPAPTSSVLERNYYFNSSTVVDAATEILQRG